MSEIGIYAGGYQRVRDYAESVDRLLLELKSGDAPTDETLKPVVTLLETLENERAAPAAVRAVGALFRARNILPLAKLKGMLAELKSKHPSRDAVAGLETVAAVLDEERAAISERLQGV
ncbi:MAG: hypothetical protein HYY24_00705 [Verrucomicrobia bacterium]|nr:hypothetical protein [Verrucomicrobiota bacterium]